MFIFHKLKFEMTLYLNSNRLYYIENDIYRKPTGSSVTPYQIIIIIHNNVAKRNKIIKNKNPATRISINYPFKRVVKIIKRLFIFRVPMPGE